MTGPASTCLKSGNHIYQVQYGRKLVYGGASEQTSALRVPAGALPPTLPSTRWSAASARAA